MSLATAVTVFLDWINLKRYWTKLNFDGLLMKKTYKNSVREMTDLFLDGKYFSEHGS